MNKLFNIIFVLLFIVFTCSFTLKGSVSYTVNEARTLAFQNVSEKIDMTQYQEYLFDKNYAENMLALKKGKKKYKGRYLTKYSDNTYSFHWASDFKTCYYYDKNGNLQLIAFILNDNFPFVTARYDILGNLDSTSLAISNDESFIFSPDKRLIAHWIDDNGYDENGYLIHTRE